jgi:hypothetical protein
VVHIKTPKEIEEEILFKEIRILYWERIKDLINEDDLRYNQRE